MRNKRHSIESDARGAAGADVPVEDTQPPEKGEPRSLHRLGPAVGRKGTPQAGGRRDLVLAFIRDFVAKNPYPPTVREIGKGCRISSTSVVDYYLSILEAEGHLTRIPHISRGIMLADRDRPDVRDQRVP